jgi:hypothetical protein
MPTRKNFSGRVNIRRKSAMERLETMKAMTDEQLSEIRRNKERPIEKHREYLNSQIEVLKKRIQR